MIESLVHGTWCGYKLRATDAVHGDHIMTQGDTIFVGRVAVPSVLTVVYHERHEMEFGEAIHQSRDAKRSVRFRVES